MTQWNVNNGKIAGTPEPGDKIVNGDLSMTVSGYGRPRPSNQVDLILDPGENYPEVLWTFEVTGG